MFCHVKDLQFDARVSEPDPRFASILLEQFGGANGELTACMQYFVQAFGCRRPFPEKYDMLMDIATEEMSHLEVVGALITMLLDGVNGELKDAANAVEWNKIMGGDKAQKEQFIHEAVMNPQFLTLTGGGPRLTDSQGSPWSGSYVNANGDLSVDLRSNIAAESRAKVVYEYLMQFTDDPDVQETLGFLMTREIAHMNMFRAALDTVEEDFPPGVLKGDPGALGGERAAVGAAVKSHGSKPRGRHHVPDLVRLVEPNIALVDIAAPVGPHECPRGTKAPPCRRSRLLRSMTINSPSSVETSATRVRTKWRKRNGRLK